jgi:hypothetical protein
MGSQDRSKTRRNLLTAALWSLVLALAINLVRLAVASDVSDSPTDANEFIAAETMPRVQEPIKTIPHMVELLAVQHVPGSAPRHVASLIHAVRADGSHVQRYEILGEQPTVQRLIRVASGQVTITDDVRELRAQVPGRTNVGALLRDPGSGCLKAFTGQPIRSEERVERRELVHGYETVVVIHGEARQWFAPSLGCASLRYRAGHITREASVIREGEPPDEIFEVSDRFKEVPLSELDRR